MTRGVKTNKSFSTKSHCGRKCKSHGRCKNFLKKPHHPRTDEKDTSTYEFYKGNKEWLKGEAPRQFNAEDSNIIPPSKNIAVITCMDARVDPYDFLNLNI